MNSEQKFIVRSKSIRVDSNNLISLDDIHRSAGFKVNQLPKDWLALPNAKRELYALLKRLTGKTELWTKEEQKMAYHVKRGTDYGTWAHENIALAYASFLSPNLAVEIRDVFLRFKAGDESLIPEIRENKSRRDEKIRQRHREIGKKVRRDYTDTLQVHGVTKPYEYAHCTNEIYKPLFGGTAQQIREQKGLRKKENIREHMKISDLAYTMAAEALASERIEDANSNGYRECKEETKLAATTIGTAIDTDRKNRQQKLI